MENFCLYLVYSFRRKLKCFVGMNAWEEKKKSLDCKQILSEWLIIENPWIHCGLAYFLSNPCSWSRHIRTVALAHQECSLSASLDVICWLNAQGQHVASSWEQMPRFPSHLCVSPEGPCSYKQGAFTAGSLAACSCSVLDHAKPQYL